MQNAHTGNASLESRVTAAHRSATLVVLVIAFSVALYLIIALVLLGSGIASLLWFGKTTKARG